MRTARQVTWRTSRAEMAEMRDAGVNADAVTFNVLLHAHGKAGDVAGARAVMAEMRDAG